ncbi:transcriptional regulator [Pseudonocardiaceae bacterium YIM PH 21723]|nr:transcriptional regulator [Pseudonocardiaceae bacterium YIM PH 21723]
MALGRTYAEQDCSLARTLEVVGERWTLLVLRDCFLGVRRFCDIQAHLDLPRAVLSDRLKSLVAAGVLEQSGKEYTLTARGLSLWPAVYALQQWGERECAAAEGRRKLFRHVACGTDVDSVGFCSSCAVVPPVGEWEIRPGPGADLSLRQDRVAQVLAAGPHRLLEPI